MQRDVYKSEDNEKNGSLDGLRVLIPPLFSPEANSKTSDVISWDTEQFASIRW